MIISDNGISKVWREDGHIYKRQPMYMTDNEWYALQVMCPTAYVPKAERLGKELIRMEDLGASESITDAKAFMAHLPTILQALKDVALRHGDLTKYAIIVKDNRPLIIDWGESRHWYDPRPDKRREGDKHWLTKTMREMCP